MADVVNLGALANDGTGDSLRIGGRKINDAFSIISSSRVVVAETRTLLKTAVPAGVAFLTEAGREGLFVWRAGNYSGQISADTQEGIWIKANSVASSAGAWVRVFDGRIRGEWFGIVGDYDDDTGTGTNNNTAFAGMLAAAVAGNIDGVTLPMALPPGKILLTQIAFTGQYFDLEGDAKYGTIIVGSNSTNDILAIGDGVSYVKNFRLANLTIDSQPTKTGGWGLRARKIVRSTLNNVIFAGQDREETIGRKLYHGVWFDGCDQVNYDQFQIVTQAIGLRVNGEATYGGAQGNLFLDNGRIIKGSYGIHVAGGFGGLTVGKVDVSLCSYGMVVDNSVVSAHTNREIFLQSGAFFDVSTNSNIEVTSSLERLVLSDAWLASAGGHGLRVISMTGQVLVGSATIRGNGGDGIRCDDPVTQWIFAGAEIANNTGYGIRWVTAPNNPEAVWGIETCKVADNTGGQILNYYPPLGEYKPSNATVLRTLRTNFYDELSSGWYVAGSGDHTTAFQDFINALASGGAGLLDTRTHNIASAITINKPIQLRGTSREGSILRSTSSSANVLNVTSESPVDFHRFRIQHDGGKSSGNGIYVDTASNYNARSKFRDLDIINLPTSIYLNDSGLAVIDGCYLTGYSNAGVVVDNVNAPDSGDSQISSCTIDTAETSGTRAAILQYRSGGLRVLSNKIMRGQYGYYLVPTGGTATSIAIVQGNSFEHQTGNAIRFEGSGYDFPKTIITGNHFNGQQVSPYAVYPDGGAAAPTLVSIVGTSSSKFKEVTVANNSVQVGLSGGTAFEFDYVDNLSLGPNTITATTGTTRVGVSIGANVNGYTERQQTSGLTSEWEIHSSSSVKGYMFEPRPWAGRQASVASTTEVTIATISISGTGNEYNAGSVEVLTEGLVQGTGTGVVRSLVQFRREAGTGIAASPTVTQLSAHGTAIAHTATISGDDLILKATFSAGATGSRFAHHGTITGYKASIVPA